MRSRVPLFHHSGTVFPLPIASRKFLRTQPVFHSKEKESDTVTGSGSNDSGNNNSNQPGWLPSLASPRQLVEYLNDYVVGQTRAKKILAVAYVYAELVLIIAYNMYITRVYVVFTIIIIVCEPI
jgi:ATP-dependent Clp protease ATP-binding subunit ClpX